MASKKSKLFLIDGSNNVYRSYFAIRGLTNSAGLATNAVYGFTTTLKKLLKDHDPDYIAVAFDIGSAKTRHEAFADYKKDRRPMPDDLAVQLPFVNEVLEGFHIPVIGVEDWEADDLIGTLACTGRDRGFDVVIATSDKDFFQLVGDGIRLYHTGREVLYDAKGVEETFGVPPDKVVEVMAIMGDAIDNIPGVPGIGEKGAKSLIQQYGSLDAVYEHLDELKPGQRKELAAAMKRLLESDRVFVAHDVKLQLRRLAANGWPQPKNFADTMIMSYVINPGLPSHALGNVARDWLKQDVLARKDVAKTAPLFALDHEIGGSGPYQQYLAEKSDITVALKNALLPELRRDPALVDIYDRIALPLIPVMARREERGTRTDVPL